MKTSKYDKGTLIMNEEFVAAWDRIDKALGRETDPDIPMEQGVLDALVVMAEKIDTLEEVAEAHERELSLKRGYD